MTKECIDDVVEDSARTERIGTCDLMLGALLAVGTFLLQWLFEYPILDPSSWEDAAVAFGVRPASHAIPGYWTIIVSGLHRVVGYAYIFQLIRFLGHLSMATIAVVVYVVMRELIAFIMRIRPQISKQRTMVSRLAAVIGAIAFITSDPVWALGQGFCEGTIQLLLTVLAIELFFAFLRKGTIGLAYMASTILGVLAAETSIGLVLPCILIALYVAIVARHPQLESPFFDPAIFEVGKWHMTFLFFVSLLAGIGANVVAFVLNHGLDAIGQSLGDVPLAYGLCYWERLVSGATPFAWVVFTGFFVVPFVVSSLLFPVASDEAQFLSYATGLVFFACGILAYSQCAPIPALWMWTYVPISSPYLLSLGNLLCSLTLASALTILGVDSLCRDHRRLANDMYNAHDDDEDDDWHDIRKERSINRMTSTTISFAKRIAIVCIPIFLLFVTIPGRMKTTTRKMLSIVSEALRETVREASDVSFLFTDGNLDAGIEIESARQGVEVRCYSLMSGSTPMDAFLRQRRLEDDEDRLSFGFDTGMGLRSWIRDKPERMKNSAVQMGFDIWKRDGLALPPMGGLLSRPTGFQSEQDRLRGVAEARRLVDEILEIYSRRTGILGCTEPSVRRAFFDVQWRLARMCSNRGEWYDLAGCASDAIAEAKLAKRLDELNPTYQGVVKAVEKRNAQLLRKMSPREGLQLALVRADFRMGRLYAEAVISADPENADANFSLGMYYLGERQLSRAESYLRRCLIRKPNEPAVYNNLAMINIEQGRFEAATSNVVRALELLPNSAVVQGTRKTLEEAIAKLNARPVEKKSEVKD